MSEILRRKIGGIILSNELDVDMKAKELYKIYQQLSEEKKRLFCQELSMMYKRLFISYVLATNPLLVVSSKDDEMHIAENLVPVIQVLVSKYNLPMDINL